MRKIRFMTEEFFRSIHKSLLKNLLLMAMFSISLVMTVIMASYYFDLGDRYLGSTQQLGDKIWCPLELMSSEDSEIEDSLMTVTGCQNMMAYYETLRSSKDCPIISVDIPDLYMKEEDVKRFFGDRSYNSFKPEPEREAVMAEFEDEGICSLIHMKSARIDLGAYRSFGLSTQEGEGFTEQNLRLEHWSDPIPILLGSDYKGIIEPGAEFSIQCWFYDYPCRVVGILEKGAVIPQYPASANTDLSQLDSQILLPFGIQVSEPAETVDEIKKYAYLALLSLEAGIAQIPEGKVKEQVAVFQDVGKEFELPPVHVVGTTMGVDLLRKESVVSIRILLILSVTLSCFTLYGIFITFYDKIQSNSRVYGIYLMNGCSLSMILIPLLLEIVVTLLPAVFVSRLMFVREDANVYYRPEAIMRAAYVMAGLIFMIGIGVVAFLMRGVDTEHLIRQKD
ncbi:MAG: hypothetical protein HFG35_13880 [Eubacterium sp.]|jgi:hypothetical protein|nr:hypothetical protein [Eubacterium sp.]